MGKRFVIPCSFLLALALAGCGRTLVTTPNVLVNRDPLQIFGECNCDNQSPDMEVLFATDRAVTRIDQRGPGYGYGRAQWLAYGTATISLNPRPTLKQLLADSTRRDRQRRYALQVDSVEQLGRFDFMLDAWDIDDQGLHLRPQAAGDASMQQDRFHALLKKRLAQTDHKDVFIFVHGFNNTFEDALFPAAEVWHFMGRVGVPVAYTWPAGYGGLRGYAYDRESGEFTVSHLKHFLKNVAACPEVERVHLVAHSRGTDVAISALRELHIDCQARGLATKDELKLANLVLAAPDLDEEVFMQRFAAENLLAATMRTTLYASQTDKAIELADVIFGSRRRLGRLGPRDFSPQARKMLANLPNLQIIDCKVTNFSNSHNYVFAHPAALSDLILVLRDRRDPGVAHGRPLGQPAEGIWELDNQYLLGE